MTTTMTYRIDTKTLHTAATLDSWLANPLTWAAPLEAVHNCLKSLPNPLLIEADTDRGNYVFALETNSAARSAAILRDAGFAIVNTNDGWTAIEPDPLSWDDAPGAHYRWRGTVSQREPHLAGADVFWISYEKVDDPRSISALQGHDDWRVEVKQTRQNLTVTFSHDTANRTA
jgi:hypothetical protein